jgi:hypothetical protein
MAGQNQVENMIDKHHELTRNSAVTKILMQSAFLVTGFCFMFAWRSWSWGPAAMMGGIFFIYIALMTLLIDLANMPGFWQPFLRSTAFGIFQLASVLVLIVATVVVGVLQNMGLFR